MKVIGTAYINGKPYEEYDEKCNENEHSPELIAVRDIGIDFVQEFYRCTKCGRIVGKLKRK